MCPVTDSCRFSGCEGRSHLWKLDHSGSVWIPASTTINRSIAWVFKQDLQQHCHRLIPQVVLRCIQPQLQVVAEHSWNLCSGAHMENLQSPINHFKLIRGCFPFWTSSSMWSGNLGSYIARNEVSKCQGQRWTSASATSNAATCYEGLPWTYHIFPMCQVASFKPAFRMEIDSEE